MADNTDNLSIEPGGFSIQETIGMGMGNQELLDGLYAPEGVAATPEEIKPIVVEVDENKVVTPEKKEEKPDKSLISDFLGQSDNEEEEEEEEDKEIVTTGKETTEEKVEEASQFKALANDLFNLGVFSKDSEDEEIEVNTPEEFLERFETEKKKGAMSMIDNFIGQFGEDYKNAFEAIYVKGVDPKEYFGVYNSIVNFAELDLTKEDNQVLVVRQSLLDQGFEPEDIDAEVERLKSYGDIEQVAQRNHKVLVKKDTQKLQEMEQKAELQNQQKAMIKNQYIKNVQSILQEKVKAKEFDGIPLSPIIADELQDFLLVDKWKTAAGETLSDFDRKILDLKRPENHAMKVKFALLLKILEKDPTLSTIQKAGVTKKTDKLFSEVTKQNTTASTAKSNSTPGTKSSWFK